MVVHLIMARNKVLDEWYSILEKFDQKSEHKVFFFGSRKHLSEICSYIPGKGILYCDSIFCLPRLFYFTLKSKRIIIHYLKQDIKLYFVLPFIKPKKITWVIWGGDLYEYVLDNIKKRSLISHFLRWFLKRIDEIAAFLKEDFDIAVASTGTKARYRYLFYPNPVNFDMLDQQSEKVSQMMKNKSTLKIMIGNSADPSNNHFEILDFLNKISKNIDMEIICPLSYGNLDYAKSVIAYGKEKFGDRFIPLTKILEPEEYAKLLVNVDIAIFNHKRQQALGNILALLYARKKVYIRSDISTWKFFERYGIKVYDTQTLISGEDANFERFDQKIGEKNRETVAKEFGSERCAELWKKAFEDYINE